MVSSNTRQSEDRRGRPRTPAVLAVALDSETKQARHGVTRNLSAKGLLIVTPSHFQKGDRLKIRMHGGIGKPGLDVAGRVARVDENPISSPELWRYRVGIELDEPLPISLVKKD